MLITLKMSTFRASQKARGFLATLFFILPGLLHNGHIAATTEIDYIAFAQGVIPVSISAEGTKLRVGFEHDIQAIDGNPKGYLLTPKPGTEATKIDIIYKLSADHI